MDDIIKNLKGSVNRDDFKYYHKQKCLRHHYGLDIDFWMMSFNVGLLAIIDFKMYGDGLTATESKAYNELMQKYPIYIIESQSNVEVGNFIIYRYSNELEIKSYLKHEWKNHFDVVRTCENWLEYSDWEEQIRNEMEMKLDW